MYVEKKEEEVGVLAVWRGWMDVGGVA